VNIFQFAWHYRRLVIFGLSFTFFSSFGQTFLVSLFVPGFLETFGITNAYFGTVYSAATLGSAFTLAWIGGKIDQIPLKKYALFVAAGLVLSALIISLSQWVWMLLLGIFGMRLFGQGLSTHTAQTAMARYFVTMRGKALSLANLGFTLGEAFLPITITTIITVLGWRAGWGSAAFFILLVLPAIILATISKDPSGYGESGNNNDDNLNAEPGQKWSRTKVIRDYRFFIFLPGVLISPFLLTGLFLYQTQLAAYKGWEIETLAAGFVAFAIARSSFSLISGILVDRFKAARLFPFFLLPFLTGLVILSLSGHELIVFAYLFLAGTTEGFGANVKTSLYAELYGTANLGAIRSMMSMFMVTSTAVSPILFGYLLDLGISFGTIIHGAVILVIISVLSAMFIYREAHRTLS